MPKHLINLSESGNIQIKGYSRNEELRLAGSGRIDAGKMISENFDAFLAGSGNITTTCIRNLSAQLSGSGVMEYGGNPSQVKQNVSGSGRIIAR